MLKEKYIKLINEKAILMGQVADSVGKDVTTIKRWLKDKNVNLTLLPVLEAISAFTGDPVSELTESN